jgi:hypothetical protein
MPDTLNSILEELYLKKLNVFDIPTSEEAISLARQKIEELMLNKEEIEQVLGEIEIPIDTDPMYVEETNNPAVIKLKSKYASIISQSIHNSMLKKLKEG